MSEVWNSLGHRSAKTITLSDWIYTVRNFSTGAIKFILISPVTIVRYEFIWSACLPWSGMRSLQLACSRWIAMSKMMHFDKSLKHQKFIENWKICWLCGHCRDRIFNRKANKFVKNLKIAYEDDLSNRITQQHTTMWQCRKRFRNHYSLKREICISQINAILVTFITPLEHFFSTRNGELLWVTQIFTAYTIPPYYLPLECKIYENEKPPAFK